MADLGGGGQQWATMDNNGQQLTIMDSNGQQWTRMDKNEQQWTTMDNNRQQWTTICGATCISMLILTPLYTSPHPEIHPNHPIPTYPS